MATKKNINRKSGLSTETSRGYNTSIKRAASSVAKKTVSEGKSEALAYKKTATPKKPSSGASSGGKMMKVATPRAPRGTVTPSTTSTRTASAIKKKVY